MGGRSAFDSKSSSRIGLRHGPYVFDRLLATGGCALVYLAHSADQAKRPVAVKRAHSADPRRDPAVRTLEREAWLGELLDHPNVVRVLDCGPQDGELLLVMEYVDGASCGRLLNVLLERRSALPISAALYIACRALEALEHAHDEACDEVGRPLEVVHRDVSPGNILLGRNGTVKLGDFGVARCALDGNNGDRGRLFGKIGYMAPEQTEGKPVDRRSDLFSLGVVLGELLTVRRLFDGADDLDVLRKVRAGDLSVIAEAKGRIPLELRLLLATALEPEPHRRFATARDMRRELVTFARRHGFDPDDSTPLRACLARLRPWASRSGTYRRAPDDEDVPTLRTDYR